MIRHEGAATKKLQFMLTTVFTFRGLTLTAGVTGVSLLGKKVKKQKREWARSPSWIFWIWWSNMCGVLGDCGLCERRLGEATMRRGSGVNGCDHSFLVNNAALLIGWINNWCGRVRGGVDGGTYSRLVREDVQRYTLHICPSGFLLLLLLPLMPRLRPRCQNKQSAWQHNDIMSSSPATCFDG